MDVFLACSQVSYKHFCLFLDISITLQAKRPKCFYLQLHAFLLSSLNPGKTYRQYLCTALYNIMNAALLLNENNYMAKQWPSFESSTHGCIVGKTVATLA